MRDSRPADTSACLSGLKDRMTDVNPCIQDLSIQRNPLLDERESLRHSHIALTSKCTLYLASTTQRMCVLADTVADSTLSHAFQIITAARRPFPPPQALLRPPTRSPRTPSCHHDPLAPSDRLTTSVHRPSTPSPLPFYSIHGPEPFPQRGCAHRRGRVGCHGPSLFGNTPVAHLVDRCG